MGAELKLGWALGSIFTLGKPGPINLAGALFQKDGIMNSVHALFQTTSF